MNTHNIRFYGKKKREKYYLATPSYLELLGFSLLWFKPRSAHMWESQVLLTDGQVVFSQGSLVFAHL